jgi:hypothetical protein
LKSENKTPNQNLVTIWDRCMKKYCHKRSLRFNKTDGKIIILCSLFVMKRPSLHQTGINETGGLPF